MMHVNAKSDHCNEVMNVEEDRLSSLPNELIHKILSFISIREAIGVSVLSSRWRSIWTSSPYICFLNVPDFSNFVYDEMSRRNNQIHLSAFKLFSWKRLRYSFFNNILDYALSLNIQILTVTCNLESHVGSPLSLFGSPPPNHLDLLGFHYHSPSYSATPALTTLHLDRITLSDSDKHIDLFSKCTNLKSLTLTRLIMIGTNVFNICNVRLSNLTFEYICLKGVNVVAPQLKNLTIIYCNMKFLKIYTPGLTSLVMKGDDPLDISTQAFHSLEKVNLSIFHPLLRDAHKIVRLLKQLHNVKLLILNWRLLEVLSSSMGLNSHQPSQFSGFKILKFTPSYPRKVYLEAQAHKKATPSTIFTMISCEDIRVMRNIVLAQELVVESRVLFQHCKALHNTTKADMEQPTESLKIKWHEHNKAQVKRPWAQSPFEMQSHFEMKQEKIEKLVKKLQHVEGLVTELPVSKRDMMQATFYSVCEEAAIVTNNMYEDLI
ncbi:unnamed protein product [Lactuca saligna]|uniref:F-box domain-containing protein n=1 Tax=Lactuca saligna TaxID=75948 RepID=A0AA35YIZ7_LACSI|nr:unnamed protein product [Lactuca saligna]